MSTEAGTEATHLLILKSETRALIQAETYLRNRKYIVGSVTSIKEALAYIVQKKPHIIFISSDIPNKKIKVLPKMLAQAFPIKCVGFCEHNSGMSVRALGDLKLEYVLYPPVSGPAVERLLLKMKKDEETRALQANSNDANGPSLTSDGKPSMIEVKGSGARPAGMTAEAMNSFLNSDSDDLPSNHIQAGAQGNMAYSGNLGKESGERAQGPGYMPGQSGQGLDGSGGYVPGQSGQSGSMAYNPSPENSGSGMGGYIPGSTGPQASGQNAQQNASSMGPGIYQPNQENPQSNAQQAGESFEQWAERMRKAATAQGEKNSGLGGSTSQSGPGMGPGFQGGENTRPHGKSEAYTMESEYVPKKKRAPYRFESDRTQDLKDEKLIVRGTQSSLEQTVIHDENINPEQVKQVEKASNIACITIQSPKFSGYLVCALGKNRKIDQNFVGEVQKKLVKFLTDNGEPAQEKDTMDMKIQEVDFTDWALQEAEFLRTSVHNGDEVAMAFFPTNDLEVKLEDSASEKMVKLSIDDLKEDAIVEFDLYIFMPGNNKYLLYTPQGMPFYGKQKNRLKEKGVSHIHLRKENALGVKKYKAQNFLNEKIEAYKAAKKLREAGS